MNRTDRLAGKISHQDYYAQFVTEETRRFVKDRIGLDKLKASSDPYLNDVVNMTSYGWVWDYTPIDLQLAREKGEVGFNSLPSSSTRTCVGKACARLLLNELEGS